MSSEVHLQTEHAVMVRVHAAALNLSCSSFVSDKGLILDRVNATLLDVVAGIASGIMPRFIVVRSTNSDKADRSSKNALYLLGRSLLVIMQPVIKA